MSTFQSIDTAATGANAARTWLDAISHNIANLNTVNPPDQEPFRAKLVVAQARSNGTGVDVVGLDEERGDPALIFDPSNPLADADGNVHRPVVDLVTQMSDLIGAQRSYQANLSVVQSSRDAYEAAMRLGK
jgi:flagellar basal-body rod protein FlgC